MSKIVGAACCVPLVVSQITHYGSITLTFTPLQWFNFPSPGLLRPPVRNARCKIMRNGKRFALAMDLPEDEIHLAMLRHVVREGLTSLQVDPQDVDDIEILVGELATNALRHARSMEGYRVEVTLDHCGGSIGSTDVISVNERPVRPGRAVVVVTDNGAGFSRAAVSPPGTIRDDGSEEERWGGWGLPLVERLADDVEFETGEPHGTRVRATKRLRI